MSSLRRGRHLARMLSCVLLCAAQLTEAQLPRDSLVQPPLLGPSQRGSLVGQYARTAFGPSDVSRGAFSLPSPFSVPTDRGEPLFNVFPLYSGDSGATEFGIGWQVTLSLTRWRPVGDIDFSDNDELSSPWGKLVLGNDGNWYPLGLQNAVRVRPAGADFVAYLADGRRLTFGGAARVDVPGSGTYAWYLSQVESATGRKARLSYQANASGKLFLRSISYGGVGDDFQYQVDFDYCIFGQGASCHNSKPFVEYRSGAALSLDRRVETVTVKAKHAQSGEFLERWHYSLSYQQDELGPAFYLSTLAQTFASGESPPPVRYQYTLSRDLLDSATFRRVTKLDNWVSQNPAIFQPDKATLFDVDMDGRPDFENQYKNDLYIQRDDGFEEVHLGEMPPDAVLGCRYPPNVANPPRHLAQMRSTDDEHSVVFTHYAGGSQSDLYLCNREGQQLYHTQVTGNWELEPNVRLVDLNRDFNPDFIRIFPDSYVVIPNLSTDSGYAFGEPITGQLRPRFDKNTSWISDFNGDGIPDIIGRWEDGVVVWFGLGNYRFAADGQIFPFKIGSSTFPDVGSYQFAFVDANGDGLTDVLLSQTNQTYLFINTGTEFVYRAVPGLGFIDGRATPALVGDLAGTGNTEIMTVRDGMAHALALNGPQVGLLAAADDGKGTVLRFSYGRSPPTPGTRHRQAVVQQLVVESSGHDAVSYNYDYQSPHLHRLGKFLVGFDAVTRRDPVVAHSMSFFNEDFVAGLILSSVRHDANAPEVDAFESYDYQNVTSFGRPWERLRTKTSGWQSADGTQRISERTDYLSYQAEVCPHEVRHDNGHGILLTEKRRATLPGLQDSMYCLDDQIVLTGAHSDPSYDFRYEGLIARNAVGLVTQVQSRTVDETLTLQDVFYNPDYTLDRISVPGAGVTSYGYQGATTLLRRVTSPDLVVVEATERNPVTDAILTLNTDRGAHAYSSYFRYDGQERLSKSWDDLGSATESNPSHLYSYRYATALVPDAVFISSLVDAQAGIAKESIDFTTAAGEPFTTVRRIPQGWVFDGITERLVSTSQRRTHLRPTLAGTVDPLSLVYGQLFSGAQLVGSATSSLHGFDADTRVNFHVDVEKHVATSLTLGGAVLSQVAEENGTFRTTETMDAGRHLLVFADEAQTQYAYQYDALARLRQVLLPDSKKHRVSYDGHGRVRFVDREGIASVEYSYARVTGFLSEKRFSTPTGEAIRQLDFEFDGIGRKTVETYTDLNGGNTQSYRYYYDGATPQNPTAHTDRGLLTAVAGDGYQKILQYRADGLLLRRSVSILGWRTVESALDYMEDNSIRQTSTTVKDAGSLTLSTSSKVYTRNDFGQISALKLDGRDLVTFGYDGNGQLASADFVNGDSVAVEYDALTRQFTGFGESTSRWNAYNSLRMSERGFVARETIAVGEINLTRVYGYSPPGFLTSSSDAQISYGYEFDSFGLPTAIQENSERRGFVRVGDVLTVGDVNYRFDALGRTIETGDLTLSYGPNDQVSSARRGSSEWTFLYDEAGQRLAKFLGGAPVSGYFEEGYLDNSGLVEPFKAGHLLVGIIDRGTFRLLAADMRGTVTADTDGTPRVASPFGDRPIHPDIFRAIDYVRKSYDADLGVVRMGARDYDPRINRFLTPDPLLLEDPSRCAASRMECNLYSYAANNPLLKIDPTGFISEAAHFVLDLAGFIPVVGTAVDLVHAGIYVSEGRYAEAALSAFSAVPLAGQLGHVGKAIGKGAKELHALATAAKEVKTIEKAVVADVKLIDKVGTKGTELVERAMSRAELKATEETGLIRGGRAGKHYVSNAVNSDAKRAQQRLALPNKPEVKVTLEVPEGAFSPPSKVQPYSHPKGGTLPGGGTERSGTGSISAKIIKAEPF